MKNFYLFLTCFSLIAISNFIYADDELYFTTSGANVNVSSIDFNGYEDTVCGLAPNSNIYTQNNYIALKHGAPSDTPCYPVLGNTFNINVMTYNTDGNNVSQSNVTFAGNLFFSINSQSFICPISIAFNTVSSTFRNVWYLSGLNAYLSNGKVTIPCDAGSSVPVDLQFLATSDDTIQIFLPN